MFMRTAMHAALSCLAALWVTLVFWGQHGTMLHGASAVLLFACCWALLLLWQALAGLLVYGARAVGVRVTSPYHDALFLAGLFFLTLVYMRSTVLTHAWMLWLQDALSFGVVTTILGALALSSSVILAWWLTRRLHHGLRYVVLVFVLLVISSFWVVFRAPDPVRPSFAGHGHIFPRLNARAWPRVSPSRAQNVYILVLHGYGSSAALQRLGIDNASFYRALKVRGFRVYDEAVTAAWPAALSIPTFFYMDHLYDALLPDQAMRAMAGFNPFVALLKSGGYRTRVLTDAPHVLAEGSPADVYWYPGFKMRLRGALLGFWKVVHYVLPPGVGRWMEQTFLVDKPLARDVLKHDLQEDGLFQALDAPHAGGKHADTCLRLPAALKRLPSEESPTVTVIYATGLPGATSSQSACDEGAAAQAYGARLQTANTFVLNTLQQIQVRDPEALVVLTSDHGPFIANGCAREADRSTPAAVTAQHAGVLCAIHWGSHYDGRYDGKIQYSVHLLRYVLSFLGGHTQLLDDLPEACSMAKTRPFDLTCPLFRVHRAGNVLDVPEKIPDEKVQDVRDALDNPSLFQTMP